ncbi:MAG: hypothetical protein O6924_02560, partial [Alphaproteobacteria bacterium]|nr:hypothetical protein [Alphaproteobacteria bacterium]
MSGLDLDQTTERIFTMAVRSMKRKMPSLARKPHLKSASTRRAGAKRATIHKATRKPVAKKRAVAKKAVAKKATIRKVSRKPVAKKRAVAKKAPMKKTGTKKPAAKMNAVHKQLAMLRKKLAKEQAF